MKVYHPSKFEIARKKFYDIIVDFALLIWIPTLLLCYFFDIKVPYSKYTEHILWFWLAIFLVMLFFSFRKLDTRSAFLIEADEQGVRLQYYRGLFFNEKLTNVKLMWHDIEKIENVRSWNSTKSALFAPIYNTLYIDTKNREHYKVEIDMCSTLMKKIDKELNEMLKQYGEPKDEK